MFEFEYRRREQARRAQQERARHARRKTTAKVALGAVTGIAALVALFAADDDDEVVADCVVSTAEKDGSYRIVDDSYCENRGAYVRWVYGGSSSGGYVRGGTTVRPSDVSISSRSGRVISRGGFGGRGSGGGG